MKKFMLLHVGFKQPTPEMMEQWNAWFTLIRDRELDRGGFMNGRELSSEGVRELARDGDCLTGYNIIRAESMDEAMKLAEQNPYIGGIRVYELRDG